MSDSIDPLAWVAKADNDLLAIELIMRGDRVPWDIVCYHAQQTAEKMLKAYIVSNQRVAAKTHDLLALLRECNRLGAGLEDLAEICKFLFRYGAIARYPGSGFEAAEEDGEKALTHARRVHARVLELLPNQDSS